MSMKLDKSCSVGEGKDGDNTRGILKTSQVFQVSDETRRDEEQRQESKQQCGTGPHSL